MAEKTEQAPQDNKTHQGPDLAASKHEEEASAASAAEQERIEELAKAYVALAEVQDKYTRLCAEFANFRRRSDERAETLREAANEAILIKLLPIIDDFERALATTTQSNTSAEATQAGVRLIYDKLTHLLQQEHVQPIEATPGTQFDAELHQAVTQAPVANEALRGKVVEVVEKGYRFRGSVLRFAKVIIGS
ncbi:MAG: nucleotide exchange factor GrpE [Bacteroidota bacterium]